MKLKVTITHNNGKRETIQVDCIDGCTIQRQLEHCHYKSISIRLA